MNSPNDRPPDGAHVIFFRHLPTSRRSVLAVLLCKRTLDAPIHPGLWSLVGGTVDKDDVGPEGTAVREVQEELGIEFARDRLSFLADIRVSRAEGPATIRYFFAPLEYNLSRLTLRPQLPCGKVEGEGIGWFAADEVHHLPVRPEDRIALARFFGEHGT